MNYKKCDSCCMKNGFQTNGTQRSYCKSCRSSQQEFYCYNAYHKDFDGIVALWDELTDEQTESVA